MFHNQTLDKEISARDYGKFEKKIYIFVFLNYFLEFLYFYIFYYFCLLRNLNQNLKKF